MADVKLEMFSLCVCSKSWILGHIHLLNLLNFGAFPTTEHNWILDHFRILRLLRHSSSVNAPHYTLSATGPVWYKNSWELLEHF
jgi:hypothetical protein